MRFRISRQTLHGVLGSRRVSNRMEQWISHPAPPAQRVNPESVLPHACRLKSAETRRSVESCKYEHRLNLLFASSPPLYALSSLLHASSEDSHESEEIVPGKEKGNLDEWILEDARDDAGL